MRQGQHVPWYRRTVRWGQTNLTEIDPLRYDAEFWREHWRRTRVQGVIVNAGGIVAYYPSHFEQQYRAAYLGERDLFGEIVEVARQEGLVVLARMDSNRATEPFYREHPDWFAVNAQGEPSRAQDRYQACVNSPYYKEYLPQVLREIIECYHPEGFTDNSWTGVRRHWICHCEHCQRRFHDETGYGLPGVADWDDLAYRHWIVWSYRCRLENWDLNNRVTQQYGGPDCLWLGMINGNPVRTHLSFCDLKAVGERSQILMCDQQSRDPIGGFEGNGLSGKLLHGVLGWEKVIPESMATYVRGTHPFRLASNPAAESRTWMVEGFAGGVSPWWHHISAFHEDRRQYRTAEPIMRWHEENQAYLYNRRPVANVGLLWSQEDIDFYGRDDPSERVLLPWHGFTLALTRARIPYLPLHADHVDRDASQFDVLILPDLAAVTDAQCAALRRYVEGGGSLVATGRSSLLDGWGDPRGDLALGDLLGVRATGRQDGVGRERRSDWEVYSAHSYLRLIPELNQATGGNAGAAQRHRVLSGFEETDILPFGGTLQEVELWDGVQVLATFVPPFPIYPPEFCWMREPRTDVPALVVREHPSGGRLVYLAADVDRCYGRQHLPDHGDLLANAVRWAVRDRLPLRVEGPGYLDCHLYRQGRRTVLHIVNLSGKRAWPAYVEGALPVGPLHVSVRLDGTFESQAAVLRVSGHSVPVHFVDGWASADLSSISDHELIVFE